jgi:general secretion pathway protein N
VKRQVTRRGTIGFAIGVVLLAVSLWGLSPHGMAAPTGSISSDALDADLSEGARAAQPPALPPTAAEPVTTVRVAVPQAAPERTLSANPLWAIPLTQLSVTRDRPIFSPSRRPPPPAIAEQEPVRPPPPPRKKEVMPPQLSLVGTIASDDDSFGIFLDQSTKAALRLRVGEDYQGWRLRAIQGREVTIEKDQQGAVLTLPEPGGSSSGEIRLIPMTASKMPEARPR